MRIIERDYLKHPLTEKEVKALAVRGVKWSRATHRLLVQLTKIQKKPRKGGPLYGRK
jgi:hypothetical protein